jgi:ABC-type nitrate/sulfonate/bicarbonate transport system substrate-binding protein
MVGKKLDIGYTGDMPSINAMSNPGTRIVGTATTWSRGQQCGLIAVPDGSTIASVEDLRGKTIAVPVGSCLHFFLLQLLEKTGLENHVTVKNMAPDAIQTGFKSGGFDAGVLQEPMMSRVLAAGDAHLLTTGADYGDIDASNLLMSKDFYQGTGAWSSVPKVDGVSAFAVAWQKANLAALNVMATDEAKTVSTIAADLPDYPSDVIRRSIYLPAGAGQPAPRLQLDADWRGTPAGTLLTSTGPAFLQGLGAAKGFDPGRAMEPRALELAAEQLVADGSTWPVVRQVGGGASVGALAIPHG